MLVYGLGFSLVFFAPIILVLTPTPILVLTPIILVLTPTPILVLTPLIVVLTPTHQFNLWFWV